jgi:hypothetical protein
MMNPWQRQRSLSVMKFCMMMLMVMVRRLLGGGEPVLEEMKHKKTNSFNQKFVKRFDHLVKYVNAHGDFHVIRKYVTVDGHFLGNWVHNQRKKYKAGMLSASRIDMITTLHFEFMMQRNFVGAKLTVTVAIFEIFKYQKEHGNIEVPRKSPFKQLHHWIFPTEAKKIIKEGEGNPQFTMPPLKSLNKLGLMKLRTQFKLKDTPTTPKATKKKTTEAPPKAKATVVQNVSVDPPKNKKKSVAAQTKDKAPNAVKVAAQTKAKAPNVAKVLQHKNPPKNKVSSPPTHTSPSRTKASLPMATSHEGVSFHFVL